MLNPQDLPSFVCALASLRSTCYRLLQSQKSEREQPHLTQPCPQVDLTMEQRIEEVAAAVRPQVFPGDVERRNAAITTPAWEET